MSPLRIRTQVLFIVALASLASTMFAQGPISPVGLEPPMGPPLPEPLTWTIVGLAAAGTSMAVARRRRAKDTDSTPHAD